MLQLDIHLFVYQMGDKVCTAHSVPGQVEQSDGEERGPGEGCQHDEAAFICGP